MTQTVTFNSFEMEMTAETTDEDIRQTVEYAQQYEFDREDISAEDVQATIEATISGLIRARNETFA